MDATWRLPDQAHSLLVRDDQPWARLALTPASLALRCWPGGQPRAVDLEHAIDQVEDAIEGAGLHHELRGILLLDPLVTEQLLTWLPALAGPGCSRDQVEAAFSTCVAQVHAGGLATTSGTAVAALLMLRELMHHLGFCHTATRGPAEEGTP